MLGDLELLFALIRITNLFFILAWRPLPKEEEKGINHYNCPGGKWGENSLRRAAALRKKKAGGRSLGPAHNLRADPLAWVSSSSLSSAHAWMGKEEESGPG